MPPVENAVLPGASPSRGLTAKGSLGRGAFLWKRFRSRWWGLSALIVLAGFLLVGLLAPLLSPNDPTIRGVDPDYRRGPPQVVKFCDHNGCSWRPFTYEYRRAIGAAPVRPPADVTDLDALDALTRTGSLSGAMQSRWEPDVNRRRYLRFFVRDWEYSLLSIDWLGVQWRSRLHLFGVDRGRFHPWGTDEDGKDVFSRTLHAIWVTLGVAVVALAVKLVSSLMVGGVSGYFGGKVDALLMSLTDAVRVVPTIPLYLACAVALSGMDLSPVQRYFAIALVIGALDFATLGRRFRTHVLTERHQDYVLAAQLSGAGAWYILRRHLVPSFSSYIIVDTLINFPYIILAETALSFLGLGLTEPVNSLGVLLRRAQDPDVQQNMPWQFIPVLVFVALVLTFVVAGDALRDAADPYGERKR